MISDLIERFARFRWPISPVFGAVHCSKPLSNLTIDLNNGCRVESLHTWKEPILTLRLLMVLVLGGVGSWLVGCVLLLVLVLVLVLHHPSSPCRADTMLNLSTDTLLTPSCDQRNDEPCTHSDPIN